MLRTSPAVDIGPATLYRVGSAYYLGYLAQGADDGSRLLVNLPTPVGPDQQSLSVPLSVGQSFNITDYLPVYADGECSITVSSGDEAAGGTPNGIFQMNTDGTLKNNEAIRFNISATNSIRASVVSNQKVAVFGIACGTALGLAYMFTGRNSIGQEGTKRGTLEQKPAGSGGDYEYVMPLPDNIGYTDGIYGFTATVTVPLDGPSDPNVKIENVPAEVLARVRRVMRT